MQDRSKVVAKIPTTTPNKVVEVKVYFKKGSGYYLSVLPVTIRKEGDATIREFDCFTAVAILLEAAERFNQKKLETHAHPTILMTESYKTILDTLLTDSKTDRAYSEPVVLAESPGDVARIEIE